MDRGSSLTGKAAVMNRGSPPDVENGVCELPVKSTVKTGHEVNQSYNQHPNSSVAVSLYLLPVSVHSSETHENSEAYELPFHQQETSAILSVESGVLSPLTLNDASSIVQHDSTDCNQFEGAIGQGLSVPRNEVNDDVYGESTENLTNVNREEILYSDPIQAGPSQSELQPADAPRRPARSAARPSRFRDDQFET